MTKLFTVAGTSSKAGVSKFRVANGTAAQRTKLLIKDGQTNIQLFDLPKPMSKEDASAFVKSKGFNFELAAPAAPKVAKAPKQKTVKLSTIVKKVSKKFVAAKATKEVPAEQLLAEVGVKPDQRKQNVDEVARIKTKNLETMRRVSNRLAALRNYY